ncbi:MAG: nucleoside-diphosphate sugar epimerase/dehydratase [Pirellulales bacterium]
MKLCIFYLTRQFHNWSRHAAFSDLVSLTAASAWSFLSIVCVNHFANGHFIPRTVLLLDFFGTIGCLGALRFSWRLLHEHALPILSRSDRARAIVVGALHDDKLFAQRLQSYGRFPFRIVGFIDRDVPHDGDAIGGIRVFGSTHDVAEIAEKMRATDVIVISGSLSGIDMRSVMEHCEVAKLNLQIIPPLSQIFNGDNQIPLKPIDIADLLRRDPVQLDVSSVKRLCDGATVFVTGAGGSIGSEICRQLLEFPLAKLVLIERTEGNLYTIEMELRTAQPNRTIVAALADVTDENRMRRLFEDHRPDVVLHVAAHKHVPMLETHPSEAVKNNVFGTALMADLADEYEVEHFVLISTDKAVNPSSIMGVTKHIAEDYVHAMSVESDTRFVVVRFGNVLGSSGSVVPLFQEQIRRGGPITITHPDMQRFFMAIPEAAQLVLQATAMGRGGEIFVLEMGDQVKIVELARDLIHLSGLPENAIEIVYSGVRPGEKLYEELYFADEKDLPTQHPKLRSAYHRPIALSEMRDVLDGLEPLLDQDDQVLIAKLKTIVGEYIGSEQYEREKVVRTTNALQVLGGLRFNPAVTNTSPAGDLLSGMMLNNVGLTNSDRSVLGNEG